ncbi:MAG: hypothetical protein Gaeavirus12_5 [Gaeavirus sp.]|uniref:Uncharacterized protein n=1 Tax=Gaeavirus sp. TaxID=2487767 RepID=A0A3G4ZZ11_9VIRU|nr:MAG: hypothetical protein Gaeavirus12_5 [Gaeavirus sp.]
MSSSLNYCLVKQNNIYEELYDILSDEDLIMDNPNHKESIKYKIKQLQLSKSFILSKEFDNNEQVFEDLMIEITREDNPEHQGNTLILYADDNAVYEVIFIENLITPNNNDSELNQFASISNLELSPIYNTCAIIKTSYQSGNLVNTSITYNDIIHIMTNNFYHTGVLINPDNTLTELEFSGDKPNLVIGNTFIQSSPIQLFGLSLVLYIESGDSPNNTASLISNSEIKGRVFITTLCPITSKRFWSLTTSTIKNITKLLSYQTSNNPELTAKFNKLTNEISDDKRGNSFYFIKKYSML